MDTKTISSGIVLVLGVTALAFVVTLITNLFFSPPKTTTVIVQRPGWTNFRGWWGQSGGGLPGWGGPKHRPSPPKPTPPSQ
jgi:hypothetical protein